MESAGHKGKILILATESCAYPGADSVGQAHSTYAANSYIIKVRSPVMFPEQFYLDCFKKGISGIIIMGQSSAMLPAVSFTQTVMFLKPG